MRKPKNLKEAKTLTALILFILSIITFILLPPLGEELTKIDVLTIILSIIIIVYIVIWITINVIHLFSPLYDTLFDYKKEKDLLLDYSFIMDFKD